MTVRIYLRASTSDQDANRAKATLLAFAGNLPTVVYTENISGTKLDRPALNRLLEDGQQGDVLLVESVDRLSRLKQVDFERLKGRIREKGLRLVVHDLPTTHSAMDTAGQAGGMQVELLAVVSNMLVDLLATMARLDNDKRIERIQQGLANKINAGWTPAGRQPDARLHRKVRAKLDMGISKADIAKQCGCGVATVYRIAAAMKNEKI